MTIEHHVLAASFQGNSNVGLYGFATDSFCLVGMNVEDSIVKDIEKVLKVPVHKITICGTNLIGVFITGHEHCLLVPQIAFDSELAVLKKLNIPYSVLPTRLTALNNNILLHKGKAFVNKDFRDKEIELIEKSLQVKARKATIAGLDIVGSLAVFSKDTCIIHDEAESEEIKALEKHFGVAATRATLNMGSPYLRSGIMVNSNGFVVGASSSGIELQNVDRAFGYIL